ncbi:serine hydrolase domain-containing protein [Microtetraspora fusca]|uniref:serine hydrolase domain-containing protein n=1 Tax=Microtetraspora fusca TaxID=1997 RepID=UPI00082F9709|nr:serine hydrolase domain-containing protein [Microtetraspora fusca]
MDLELVERAVADFTPDGPDAPGLAVGVYSGGRALYTAARGVATVEFGVPIDARTRFDIASASKQFTAACVLMLAHEGRLSLDDDVRKHVPELALESAVTIGQCLNHTGGLPEWYALQAITGVPLQVLTEERLMKIISRIRRTTFEPGTAFSYSNTGYVLAAVVVRRVTGKSLAEFAAERVFGPLGMDDTVYRDDASVPLPRMAFGYAAGPVRADTEEGAVGDGGLVTSVSQLAPWFGFLADGRVLGTRLRDALLERGVLADGTVLSYAYGIFHSKVGELDAFGHTGGMHGYVSNLLYLPGPDLGVAVLTNQSALDPVGLSRRVALELTGRQGDSENVARGQAPAPVVGHWYEEATDTPITIAEAAEGRVAIVQQEAEFAPGTDGRWYGVGEARTTWLAVEDGALVVGSTPRDEPPMIFTPCSAPGEDRAPDGAWLSDEYGVLAVIKDGTFTVGLTLELDTEPAPAGAWRAGPFTLRVEPGGDLTISGEGFRRMRFTAQPEGSRPVGIPPGLV